MANFQPTYGAAVAVFGTTDLDGLASSTALLAGRASAVITNTANDVLLAGRFKANNTAPTAGQILVYVGGILNDTPTYPDVFDGTSKAATVTSAGIRAAILRQVISIDTDTTANRVYEFAPINLSPFFGGVMPAKWWAFATHSMVQTLNTTANAGGQCWYTPITYPA